MLTIAGLSGHVIVYQVGRSDTRDNACMHPSPFQVTKVFYSLVVIIRSKCSSKLSWLLGLRFEQLLLVLVHVQVLVTGKTLTHSGYVYSIFEFIASRDYINQVEGIRWQKGLTL